MMKEELSTQTIQIIKDTASLVTVNDEKISLRMYEILFSKYPHIEELFADAPEDQYMRLAQALSAYAINIDNLDILKPALKVISTKHARAGVKREQYIIVGQSLIKSMEEILGETATPEFIDAWREVYIYISEVLISLESE